jgi:hypothetical protein
MRIMKSFFLFLFPNTTKIFLKYIFKKNRRSFLRKKTKISRSIENKSSYKIMSFGNRNKNKTFYVIKRFKGGGFFSNFLFVLNHLVIADKLNFIPVVDMENFTNLYSEKKLINNSKNVWEHLFERVSKFSLKEVYKSKNVIFTEDEWSQEMSVNYNRENKKNLLKVYKKYIRIKPFIHTEVNKFIKKNFTNRKVLGVHWRGTDHKTLPNHPYPATKKQIFTKVDELIKKEKYTKIFLVTEDKKNFDSFLNHYGCKVCFYNSFRAYEATDFDNCERKNHRYNLSKESLIEAITFSKLNTLVCSRSNISEAGVFISKNDKYKIYQIDNGFSRNSLTLALFSWHLKSKLPVFLGGFETDNSNKEYNRKRV